MVDSLNKKSDLFLKLRCNNNIILLIIIGMVHFCQYIKIGNENKNNIFSSQGYFKAYCLFCLFYSLYLIFNFFLKFCGVPECSGVPGFSTCSLKTSRHRDEQ